MTTTRKTDSDTTLTLTIPQQAYRERRDGGLRRFLSRELSRYFPLAEMIDGWVECDKNGNVTEEDEDDTHTVVVFIHQLGGVFRVSMVLHEHDVGCDYWAVTVTLVGFNDGDSA